MSPRKKVIPREGSFASGSFLSISFCQFQIEASSIRSPRKSAAMFLSCLHFAVCKGSYSNVNLKVKQVKCLQPIFFGSDVVAVLPTGYGKSLIFQLLPSLLHAKITSCHKGQTPSPVCPIIIVVSPMNALIKDQMRKSTEGNVSAAFLDVRKKNNSRDLELDVNDTSYQLLKDAKHEIIFIHPEAFVSCGDGMQLLQSPPYQRSVKAVVVDEAHCILEW